VFYIPDVRAPGAHFPGEPRRRARRARQAWEQYSPRLAHGRIIEAELVADRRAPRGTAVWFATALDVGRS
jgi:hypothetical protein